MNDTVDLLILFVGTTVAFCYCVPHLRRMEAKNVADDISFTEFLEHNLLLGALLVSVMGWLFSLSQLVALILTP